ncbi:MAG: DNA polymerase I [Gammaproteobacteria bacterium]
MTQTSEPKPIILIDGSSYLYRAFHALPPLNNSKGEPTGAIYGVLNMIRKLIADYQPENIAVIFDAPGKTFRHGLSPAYKANRPSMPDLLRAQVEPLYTVIRAMGLPLILLEGLEADDIIATLTQQALQANHTVLISTGDKDLAQLVSDQVSLINTMSGALLTPQAVKDKFGVHPHQIIDYLSLIGDSVDNIAGVPKVGPKTAAQWLEKYESLQNIMQRAEEFPGKIGENLRASLQMLPLSQQLITLKIDENLPFTVKDLKPKAPDQAQLITLFQQLEFKSWLKELLDKQATPHVAKSYQTILTEAECADWMQQLSTSSSFALATQTENTRLVGIAVAVEGQAAYLPLAHDDIGAPAQLDRQKVLAQLQTVLNDPQRTMIAQNVKNDLAVLKNYGLSVKAQLKDTMLESYILESHNSRHDLETLSLKYLGHRAHSLEEIAGKGQKQLSFNQISVETATAYAAENAELIWRVHQILSEKLADFPSLEKLLSDIEMPLLVVLERMERIGVRIDPMLLQQHSVELTARIEALEHEAHQLVGRVFNLASPKQLQEILFTELKLPVIEKTAGGLPSTGEAVLQELAADYRLPQIVLEHRGLCKLKSTYTDTLPKQIDPKTGRIHTSYNQAITSTGRLSSTNPNLQNIPIRNVQGRRIRQAFIASPGYKILSADYSQIELRIMAHLSQDPGLLNAFAHHHDIHAMTAAEVLGIPLSQVTAEQRRHAKAVNFGLLYGMSAFGLSKQLNISRELAQNYMDKYFERYPKVKSYMDGIRALAHQQGYVETLFGRRLQIPEIYSSQIPRRRAAERAAINAPMQGTAADIIKMAMIRLDQWIEQGQLNIKMIMQVHDELVFEVAADQVETAKQQIAAHMTEVNALSVPLVVNVGVGDNWDEAH